MKHQIKKFIRRFLIYVLPSGFHRIRHYGLLSNKARTQAIELARNHLNVVIEPEVQVQLDVKPVVYACRKCGEPMIITEVIENLPGSRTANIGHRTMTIVQLGQALA